MSEDERIRRPPAERTAPIRSWTPRPSEGARRPDPQPGEDALRDVIARSVDLGYRVVDEYIQQGQRAARLMNERQFDAEAAAREAPELFSRMLRTASDFASLWLEIAGLAQSAGAQTPWPRPSGAAASAAPQAPSLAASEALVSTPISVEVRSSRRTTVKLDVRPGPPCRSLAVHELRSADPDKPRLAAHCDGRGEDGAFAIVVEVPDAQPAGVYSGLLLDAERSVPVGSLCVSVDALPTDSAR